MRGRCFYCDEIMREKHHVTRDHLVARMYARELGSMPTWWHESNLVKVCAGCNGYKGHLKALDWLVIMPQVGASRTAAKLIHLGMDKDAVARAMCRRSEAMG